MDNRFDEVDVQDGIVVVEHLEDDDNDVDLQNEAPEEGCEVQICINVLHDVVVVDLDLQDRWCSAMYTYKGKMHK